MIKEYWNKLQDKYIILCPFFWTNLKYTISCFFRNRNQWVNDAVGRQWNDKSSIIENVLFAAIIHYIDKDGENAFNTVGWDHNNEVKEYKKQLMEIYNWAKSGRVELQKKIDDAYPNIDIDNGFPFKYTSVEDAKKSYEELYGEVNRLEALLYDTDTRYLNYLVTNRNILWT